MRLKNRLEKFILIHEYKPMKALCCLTAFLLIHAVCLGRDSAYKALRVVGGAGNDAALNHVIEVKGKNGDPQPVAWVILLDDQNARGGVREVEVSNGKIVSEHTPVRSYVGSSAGIVMDFKRLNLDSEGAFTIANQEATKRNTGFDSVDYALRSDDQTNAPVWVLKLLDTNNVNVGTVYIAADNGAVLRTDGFGAARHDSPDTTTPHQNYTDTYTPPDTVQPAPSPLASGTSADDDDNPPPGKGVGHEINKGFHRIGASLQQFFTGKRTWDQKFQDEP